MRQSDHGVTESTQVKQTLAEYLGISLTVVDASQRFLDALKNIIDPEYFPRYHEMNVWLMSIQEEEKDHWVFIHRNI